MPIIGHLLQIVTDLSWIKAEEYNFILENYDSFLKRWLIILKTYFRNFGRRYSSLVNTMLKSMLLAVKVKSFQVYIVEN